MFEPQAAETTPVRTALFSDERMLQHDTGDGHPERPARLEAIRERFEDDPIAGATWIEPRPTTPGSVERLHDSEYVRDLEKKRGERAQLDGDTVVSPESVPAAYLAAGAAMDAVSVVLSKRFPTAFSFVRPPGHHAEADRAMGFCLFNNVALAAEAAIRDHGLKRVMIVDWDVHHGNGTQHLFEDRNDVLFVSLHQYPLFPGTGGREEVGRGEGEGFTVNVPLPSGSGDGTLLDAFHRLVLPIGRLFAPQLILVSAGFDAHERDPLAGLTVTTNGFAKLCAMTRSLAESTCDGRIVLVLEGGYDLTALADSVHACVETLAAETTPSPYAGGFPRILDPAVDKAIEVQRRYWALSEGSRRLPQIRR